MHWLGFLIVMAVGFVVIMLLTVWGIPANERRLAARAPLDWPSGERSAAARDAVWGAEEDPAECPHDDVVEDWDGRLGDWYGGLQPAAPKILDVGGVCRQCGSRVIRHGSPYAWSEWMIDPTVT